MNILDKLYLFSYLLNKKLETNANEPKWVASASLGLLFTANILTLFNIISIFTKDREPFQFGYWIILGLTIALILAFHILFVRNRRFAKLAEEFEDLPPKGKRAIGLIGGIHLGLSFVLFIGTSLVLVGVLRYDLIPGAVPR